MAERRGKGLQIPLHGFKSRSDLHCFSRKRVEMVEHYNYDTQFNIPRTIGSAVEHHIDIVGVTGSIPVSSTWKIKNLVKDSSANGIVYLPI